MVARRIIVLLMAGWTAGHGKLGEAGLPEGFTFVIADDHPLFRGALKEALGGVGSGSKLLEAGDFESVPTSTSSCSTSQCRAPAGFPGWSA
jgi:hypothetical protein